MKKSYLAAAAILGAAVFAGQAHAVKIDLGEGKSFNMGFRAIIEGGYYGKRSETKTAGTQADENGDKADLRFGLRFARIYANGAINEIFKWGWQAEFGRGGTPDVIDAFVLLDFAKEAKVMAGAYKVPFELHSGIQSGWSHLFPTGTTYGEFRLDDDTRIRHSDVFTNPLSDRMARSGSRSPGLTLWGDVADGMVRYYLGVFDGSDEEDINNNVGGRTYGSSYVVRLQFTPTMLGYKPNKGYVLKETYAGKQDILQVGVSYARTSYDCDKNNSLASPEFCDDATSWGVDLLWEQNLGAVTPNFSVGYVNHKAFRGNAEYDMANNTTVKDDRKGLLVQGGVMLNQVVGFGKPAFVVRWIQSKYDERYTEVAYGLSNNAVTGDPKLTTFGVGVNYYIKGPTNRIALGIDRVKIDNIARDVIDTNVKDSYTDIQLSFWYNF